MEASGVGGGVRRWGRGGNRDQRGGGAPGRVDVQRGVVLPGGSAGDSAAGRGEQQQQQQQQLEPRHSAAGREEQQQQQQQQQLKQWHSADLYKQDLLKQLKQWQLKQGTVPSFGASSAERLRGGDQCSFAGGGASTVYHHIHWAGAHTTTATEGGGAVHAISGYPHLRGPPEFYAAFPAAEEGKQKPIAGSEEVKEKSQTPVLERWASLIEPTRREERFALLALGLTKRVVSETRRKAVQRIQRRWHEQGELLKRSRWAQRERALEELYLSLSLSLSLLVLCASQYSATASGRRRARTL